MFQAGRERDISTHDVDAIIMECAGQVEARFGCILLEVEPLPRDNVVGLHGEHVLTLAASAVGPQFMETPTYYVDGLFH